MKNTLKITVRIIDRMSLLSANLLSMLLLLMIFIVMYEVIARYLFNSPTSWALEAVTMVFGTYMIGGGAYAVLSKAHVNMDIFYTRWSKKNRAIVDACTFPLVAFYFSVMTWLAIRYAVESFTIAEHAPSVWGPPIYHWKIILAVGLALLWLQLISDFIKNLTFALTGERWS
ncbi:TRAP transporter small permease subunit [Desulfogranum japonicum]|uniref:TRAP transporter small permease subunit n=1 Tax=Desulfogranum japonicum TaxID=231447 RepID=UPI0004242240|nr:TRAP transporter small permease subunit [Desulfogranum japonicum]